MSVVFVLYFTFPFSSFSYMEVLYHADSFGSVHVAELTRGDMDQIQVVGPPFDYIIGTDVVSFINSMYLTMLSTH